MTALSSEVLCTCVSTKNMLSLLSNPHAVGDAHAMVFKLVRVWPASPLCAQLCTLFHGCYSNLPSTSSTRIPTFLKKFRGSSAPTRGNAWKPFVTTTYGFGMQTARTATARAATKALNLLDVLCKGSGILGFQGLLVRRLST